MNQFSRTQLLLGKKSLNKLAESRVIVFGVGGVGGYVAEALARSGVGHIELVDMDTVSETNINRQIIALYSTVGRYKTEVMRDRIMDINPEADVVVHNCFYLPETSAEFDFKKYDYIVDAVDTVAAKISLVMAAEEAGTPIISSMGAGNKLDPTAFEVSDIFKTSVCPLAKTMRRELKKRGIRKLKCVYSKEEPLSPARWMQEYEKSSSDIGEGQDEDIETAELYKKELEESGKRQLPGSVAFVPSVAGLILAGEVIKDITNLDR